eukprot:Filipodium_phascolosomae@DN2930_c0_g1_i1.p1
MNRPSSGGPSSLFESYEEDFVRDGQKIRSLLGTAEGRTNDGLSVDRGELLSCQKTIQDAESALKQLEAEFRTLPNRFPDIQERLRQYRADCQDWRQRVVKIKSAMDDSSTSTSASLSEQQRLLAANSTATDRMRNAHRQLEEANRLALETEELGGSISSDLRSQRETIQRSRFNMAEVSGYLDAARTSVDNMTRRMLQNRCVLTSVCLLLLIGVLIIVSLKLKSFVTP